MSSKLDDKYYMLTLEQFYSGGHGRPQLIDNSTIWWFKSKHEAIKAIIDYFNEVKSNLGDIESLDDETLESIEEIDKKMELLKLSGSDVPDDIIQSIYLDYGETNSVTVFGKGKEKLFEILKELEDEARHKHYYDEDFKYDKWLSKLIKKIESDDLTIFDDLEEFNKLAH